MRLLGWSVRTVAGAGSADRLVPGLSHLDTEPVDRERLREALAGAELVIAENVLSLPLKPAATVAVATELRGRATVVHHHDLPWHRPSTASQPVPVDREWRHVTTSALAATQLLAHGVPSTVMRNRFDCFPKPVDRPTVRAFLGVDGPVLVQPSRAIARKNVSGGLKLASELGALYWLTGPAEDGFDAALQLAFAQHAGPHLRGNQGLTMTEVYAASDAVVLPSLWEGFGNPGIESACHRKPFAAGPYPVADELIEFGFRWFRLDEAARMSTAMHAEWPGLDHNWQVAKTHFDLADLPAEISDLLDSW